VASKKDDFLEETTRAEDIILGGLGFGEEAKIVEICFQGEGFTGTGAWTDGVEFEFSSDDELTALEQWAIQVLQKSLEV